MFNNAKSFLIGIVLVASLVGGPWMIGGAAAEPAVTVERAVTGVPMCGNLLTVTLKVDWSDAQVLVMEEFPPEGWKVQNASNGGERQDDGSIRWASFDPSATRFTYKVQVPSGTDDLGLFNGTYRDNTMTSEQPSAPIAGASELDATCDPGEAGSVVRTLPDQATCGQSAQVELAINAPARNTAWILDEQPPVSVKDVDSKDYGSSTNGHVKWVSTSGGSGERSYTIAIPADTADGTTLIFRGEYRFEPSMGSRAPVEGDRTLTVTCDGTPSADEEEGRADGDPRRSPPLPPPSSEVDGAPADEAPKGAVGAYAATVSAQAGEGVRVRLGGAIAPSISVYPSSDLAGAQLSLVVWPWDLEPSDAPTLPRGLEPAYFLELTVDGAAPDDRVVFTFDVPAESVLVDPNSAVLMAATDDGWTPSGAVPLTEAGDTYTGEVQADCCGTYVLGYDILSPAVEVEPVQPTGSSLSVSAQASDNVGLDRVELLVDGTAVATLYEAPFTFTLSEGDFEAGEHTVELVAYDLVGSKGNAAQTASFGGSTTSGSLLLAVGGLVVLLGALGATLWLQPDLRNRVATWASALRPPARPTEEPAEGVTDPES